MMPLLVVALVLALVLLAVVVVFLGVQRSERSRSSLAAHSAARELVTASLGRRSADAPDAAWRAIGGVTMAALAADRSLYAQVRDIVAEPTSAGDDAPRAHGAEAGPPAPEEPTADLDDPRGHAGKKTAAGTGAEHGDVWHTEPPDHETLASRPGEPAGPGAPGPRPGTDDGADAGSGERGIGRDSAAYALLRDDLHELDSRLALLLGEPDSPWRLDVHQMEARIGRSVAKKLLAPQQRDAASQALGVFWRMDNGDEVDAHVVLEAETGVRKAWRALARFGVPHPPGPGDPAADPA